MGPSDATRELWLSLQSLFAAQAEEVMSDLTLDNVPNLSHWDKRMAELLQPLILRLWQEGMMRNPPALRRRPVARPVPITPKSLAWCNRSRFKDWRPYSPEVLKEVAPTIGIQFDDWYNPKIIEAVEALTLEFCAATNAQATMDIEAARDEIRRLLKRGLSRNQSVYLLGRQVQNIIADPKRAFTISVTESSRAENAGTLMRAKEEGVKRKSWLASSAACDRCSELEDLGDIPIDKPFIVLPGGGPYARVMAPPLHPHCFCVIEEVI